jgi:preprotein translocase subunit YajC
MFITPAFADTAASATDAAASNPSLLTAMMPIFLIIAVFYFMVIRPQNKRVQEHRNIINALEKGDKVVTGGGLLATVKKVVSDDEVVLEIADGVEVHAVRSTILAKK